jgi:hypothetical protein
MEQMHCDEACLTPCGVVRRLGNLGVGWENIQAIVENSAEKQGINLAWPDVPPMLSRDRRFSVCPLYTNQRLVDGIDMLANTLEAGLLPLPNEPAEAGTTVQ